jgi:hypothetical protein
MFLGCKCLESADSDYIIIESLLEGIFELECIIFFVSSFEILLIKYYNFKFEEKIMNTISVFKIII